jgi:broad specificity phosphatase PhoE
MGHLLLVRHGQASFGAADYDVLSERGWEQGRLLGTWLHERGIAPSAVVRGTMRRHRETTEAMTAGGGWDGVPVAVDPGWDEFDHVGLVAAHPAFADAAAGADGADQTSIDRRRFQEIFEEATARWTAGEQLGTTESYADFLRRVRGSLEAATAGCGSGETVVVVTSGGPIAVVAASLVDPTVADDQAALARLWSRFNTVLVNAAYTRLLVGSTGARLLTFNEHHHLRGDEITYR